LYFTRELILLFMKFPYLLIACLVAILSCQKEPDVNLEPDLAGVIPDTLTITYFSPDSAMAGMPIRIGGSGFDSTIANTLVTINNIPVTLVSVTDTLIIAIIPENASTGKVAITVDGKTVTSINDLVIFQKPPEPLEKNIWVRKSDYPGQRADFGPDHAHSFSLGGKGYYLTFDGLWEFDPGADTWTKQSSVPAGVNAFGFCFTLGSKAYIGLGASAPGDDISGNKAVWEYDAASDTWTKKQDFPGSPRVVPFGFSIGNAGYIGGGDTLNAGTEDNIVFDVWKYNPATDSWTRQSDFPGSRGVGLSAVSVNNSGYLVELGSNDPTAPIAEHKNIHAWKYDPANDKWEQKAKLPTQSVYDGGGTSFVINDKIYLAAGVINPTQDNGQTVMQNFWQYDPALDTWTNKKDIGDGSPRLFSYAFSIDGKGYLGLGTGAAADEIKMDFWQYNP
jgi:hypothetical protein